MNPSTPEAEGGWIRILSIGTEADEVSACLMFGGEAVNPDEITKLLGVEPSRTRYATEIQSGSSLRPMWRRNGPRVRGVPLERQIKTLLDELPQELAIWEDLRPFQGQVFCGLWLHEWN